MGERRGMNNTHLKNRNRGLTLQLISAGQLLSRADITKRIGLTKMTVTNIVAELIADGFVIEKSVAETMAVGRNPVQLDIAPHAPKALGIYLSRESVSVILSDLKLHLLYSRSIPLAEETADSLREKLLLLAEDALSQTDDAVLGIGISAIGPLDTRSGLLLNPAGFFGIRHFPIVSLLEEATGLAVGLDNDGNAAALAERLYGLGRTIENFLYIGLSNGIGAGIVSGGRLYQDHNGFVGEIGHTSINFDGPLCACGRQGCLEVYASMPVILNKLRVASGQPKAGYRDFEVLMREPACDAVFRDMTSKLAAALSNAVNLLDPQCILIGHEGAYLPDMYVKLLEQQINQTMLSSGYRHVLVAKSIFESRAPLVGSVCCIFQKLFFGTTF